VTATPKGKPSTGIGKPTTVLVGVTITNTALLKMFVV
jgi:hypothetical protein